MKNPSNTRAPSFDAGAISKTIQRTLASAGLDITTASGPLQGVAETIRRALAAGGLEALGGAPDHAPPVDAAAQRPGSFETHEFSNGAGTRAYKLYLPSGPAEAPRAMLVMLHGCTQSADDFAAGTQMNRLAQQQGLLVVYPEQAAQANPSRCWNWFKPEDQQRDAGEPSLIAGIVREVAARHAADPRRIFVAGLSAGAAMAVVLGQTYPDLFAGVGAHSGLAYRSAHDIPSALAAMKGGRGGMAGLQQMPAAATADQAIQAVPVIVFHGDRDHTVQASNAACIVRQALQAHRLPAARAGGAGLSATTLNGIAPGGRHFSRTVHADAAGQPWVESWTLQGGGHAWSGGHSSGSFTDRNGPDASAEMLRFFLSLARAGSA